MTWIVARAVKNTPGKRDATGAFIPESLLVVKAIEKVHPNQVRLVNLEGRPEPLWAELSHLDDLEGLVYLGHGLALSLPSLGLRGKAGAQELASRVHGAGAAPDVVVSLMACSAARAPGGVGTDGGFCDEVRDALCREGLTDCRVWGHTSAGRATQNPYLAFFEGSGSAVGGQGGSFVVRPQGPAWKTFVKMLNDSSGKPSFRHRIPLMTPQEVLCEVVEYGGPA